jgi:hypothetical protein
LYNRKAPGQIGREFEIDTVYTIFVENVMRYAFAILTLFSLLNSPHNALAQDGPPVRMENSTSFLTHSHFGGSVDSSCARVSEATLRMQGESGLRDYRVGDACSGFLRTRSERIHIHHADGARIADNPNSPVYLPDSLVLYAMSDTIRMIATYTPQGWNTQILAQVWYSGHWVSYSRDTWTYLDANGSNLTLHQLWANGQWNNVDLDSSTYDARGNMLVHLYKHWQQGAWKDSILSSRTYDANGNILTNAGWYMINNSWRNYDRKTYTYDIQGNLLTYLFELWSGSWVNSDRYTYSYDVQGHLVTILRQSWNGQWENATFSTYTYDANGNLQSDLLQIMASGQWTNYTIHTYTYNANGKMLTDWYKGWTNGSWMNGTLTTCTYDAGGNMVNKIVQEWLNGAWTNYRQSTFTYDSHGNEITGNNMQWSGSAWAAMDDTFILTAGGSSYSFTGYRIFIAWRLFNTSDVSGEKGTIAGGFALAQNYPNPFNPSTTIRYALPHSGKVSLTLYNSVGQRVAELVNGVQHSGNHDVVFTANGLASGVYYCRLQAGEFVAVKQLLLIK